MLKQILRAQWMASRAIVIAMSVLAFTVPLGSVYYGADLLTSSEFQVSNWLSSSQTVGQVIPMVALALGTLLGMAAWAPDHAGRHVYALSLPVPRGQFVLMRFVAGVILLSAPVLSLGAGALLASAVVSLPEGIRAYPLQLTGRFALSALVMFTLFFSISVATKRAVLFCLGAVGGVLLADVLLAGFGSDAIVLATVFDALTTFPGPLAILMGRWALFDV